MDEIQKELGLSGRIVAAILDELEGRKGLLPSEDEEVMQEITDALLDIVDAKLREDE